jgi:energy-coupling factor transporter transmembrane protein EcfT
MKIIHSFLRWGVLYLLVLLMVGAGVWEQTLPVISIDHTLLLIGILVLFGILINLWVSHNETNFLVSQNELRKENDESKQFELSNDEAHSEKAIK